MAGEQEELKVLAVDADGAGRRLDVYLAEYFAGTWTRSQLKRLIDAGTVTLNGKNARGKDLVASGDEIRVRFVARPPSPLTPIDFPLSILFEDDDIVVVDKPAGLSVHPGAGASQVTLVHALLHHTGPLPAAAARDPLALGRPGIVHRLDKDTTGVIVCAKSDLALAGLSRQFHDKKEIVREYTALLDGVMMAEEVVHASYLFRDPASRVRFASLSPEEHARLVASAAAGGKAGGRTRFAKSAFRRGEEFENRLTLARVRLFTGRTHQIRVHAKDLGLPVVGDPVYGRVLGLPRAFPEAAKALLLRVSRQLLHARLLVVSHPRSGQSMRFEAPYPTDFAAVLAALRGIPRPLQSGS